MTDDDRTVHAKLADGTEIVRYERAGKWYAEHPVRSMKYARRHIGVNEAAQLAIGGFAYHGRPGGSVFWHKLMKLRGLS